MADNSAEQPIEPPVHLIGVIRYIGPGLIIAGSIVGSGELIATTKAGAEAGFTLLWLILIGCVVKVFAQIEFGRYAIISGKTTLDALDEVPGPRIKGRGNWLGLVLGLDVGRRHWTTWWNRRWCRTSSGDQRADHSNGRGFQYRLPMPKRCSGSNRLTTMSIRCDRSTRQRTAYGESSGPETQRSGRHHGSIDEHFVGVGRYGLIQTLATVLVAAFTLMTIANLLFVAGSTRVAIGWSEFLSAA